MAQEVDDELRPYGPSPAQRVGDYFRRAPAMGAVLVELLFVVIFANQWMVDHIVVPWESSASPVRRGLAPGLGAFGWTFTPVLNGYNWIWLASLVHVIAWLVVTFLLVRVSVRTREVGARFIATVGSVLIAAIAALLVQRLVAYPDLSRLQDAATSVHQAGPGLVPWLFFGSIPGASVLLAVIVGALAAITSGQLALAGDEEAGEAQDAHVNGGAAGIDQDGTDQPGTVGA